MPQLRLHHHDGLTPADTPRRDTRRGRHREPGRAWRSTHRWQTLRRQVLAEQPHCTTCHTTTDLTVDHITPVSRGGDPYDRANCRTLCRSCNSRRGNARPPQGGGSENLSTPPELHPGHRSYAVRTGSEVRGS
jgi:5-methylcytosine-specific restriction endonuclease McrA